MRTGTKPTKVHSPTARPYIRTDDETAGGGSKADGTMYAYDSSTSPATGTDAGDASHASHASHPTEHMREAIGAGGGGGGGRSAELIGGSGEVGVKPAEPVTMGYAGYGDHMEATAKALQEELRAVEADMLSTLRVVGLRRGQENMLVEKVRMAQSVSRRWEQVMQVSHERAKGHIEALEEQVAMLRRQHRQDREARAADELVIASLRNQIESSAEDFELRLSIAQKRHERQMSSLKAERAVWKSEYSKQTKDYVVTKLRTTQAQIAKRSKAEVDAAMLAMEAEYRSRVQQHDVLRKRFEELEKKLAATEHQLEASVVERKRAAAIAKQDEEARISALRSELAESKTREGSIAREREAVLERLRILELSVKTNQQMVKVAHERRTQELAQLAERHRVELSAAMEKRTEDLAAIERRVVRVIADRDRAIATLRRDLEAAETRAKHAEALLGELDRGLTPAQVGTVGSGGKRE